MVDMGDDGKVTNVALVEHGRPKGFADKGLRFVAGFAAGESLVRSGRSRESHSIRARGASKERSEPLQHVSRIVKSTHHEAG